MTTVVIGRQFCGPPNSGNGGYVCGVLAKDVVGPARAVLRAPVPLDLDLELTTAHGVTVMTGAGGTLIGQGESATLDLVPPPAPSLAAAQAAGRRYQGLSQRFHPICFTCGVDRHEGDGLRVFVGQLDGAPPGHVAGAWTPHADLADAEGLTPSEIVWAAIDCPGYFAWVEAAGRHGALLGTMTGEVLRRPKAGEPCIVAAWPLARDGRKEISGVALFSAQGELLALAHQVWIVMGPPPAAQAATPQAAGA